MSNSLHETNQNLSRQYVLDGFVAKHNKRRVTTVAKRFGALVVGTVLVIGAGATLRNMNTDYQLSEATITVTTQPGDTLSSLAKDVPGSEHVDINLVIDKIEELNQDTIVDNVIPAYAEITLPASVVEEGEIVDDTAVADNN